MHPLLATHLTEKEDILPAKGGHFQVGILSPVFKKKQEDLSLPQQHTLTTTCSQ